MAFHCKACGYNGKQFAGGACPACGSYNASSRKAPEQEQPKARTPFRLALMIAIWGLWFVLIYRQFFSS